MSNSSKAPDLIPKDDKTFIARQRYIAGVTGNIKIEEASSSTTTNTNTPPPPSLEQVVTPVKKCNLFKTIYHFQIFNFS